MHVVVVDGVIVVNVVVVMDCLFGVFVVGG